MKLFGWLMLILGFLITASCVTSNIHWTIPKYILLGTVIIMSIMAFVICYTVSHSDNYDKDDNYDEDDIYDENWIKRYSDKIKEKSYKINLNKHKEIKKQYS